MRDISVIGNVQADVIASPVRTLPAPGADLVVERISLRAAGAAGNTALALAALGVPVRLIGAVGDDNIGRFVLGELHAAGVGEEVLVLGGERTGVSIAVEAPDRERAFLTDHGLLARYSPKLIPVSALQTDLILLTGYFSIPGLRGEGTRKLLRRIRRSGGTALFDTGWDPDDWRGHAVEEVLELAELAEIFLPNEAEARVLTGASSDEEAARLLQKRCGGWVVVKRGSRGAIACGPAGAYLRVTAPKVEVVDTTGAGDSFAAGMLFELARGADMQAALRTGVLVASTVIARPSENRYPTRVELGLDPA